MHKGLQYKLKSSQEDAETGMLKIFKIIFSNCTPLFTESILATGSVLHPWSSDLSHFTLEKHELDRAKNLPA